MTVRQIMNKKLITVPPKSSVQEAAASMRDNNVGSILVMEDGMKLKGVLTDRDITLEVVAENKDLKKTLVSDVMTENPVTCEADLDIHDAIKIMGQVHIMRMPIMENGKVAGIISLADLSSAIKTEIDQFMSMEEACLKGQY